MNKLGEVKILRRYQTLVKSKGKSDAADATTHISSRANSHQWKDWVQKKMVVSITSME